MLNALIRLKNIDVRKLAKILSDDQRIARVPFSSGSLIEVPLAKTIRLPVASTRR
jgi:hypothetical protein